MTKQERSQQRASRILAQRCSMNARVTLSLIKVYWVIGIAVSLMNLRSRVQFQLPSFTIKITLLKIKMEEMLNLLCVYSDEHGLQSSKPKFKSIICILLDKKANQEKTKTVIKGLSLPWVIGIPFRLDLYVQAWLQMPLKYYNETSGCSMFKQAFRKC